MALTFPPGFPRVARLGAHVEGNARATLADLATLRAAAASAVEAVGLVDAWVKPRFGVLETGSETEFVEPVVIPLALPTDQQ